MLNQDKPSRSFKRVDKEATVERPRFNWREDLLVFRGLSERERGGFLILLEWFENFRLRLGLPAGRKAAIQFWKNEVMGKSSRESWQLDQWSAALDWYLKWLQACEEAGADHRSVAERVRMAVERAATRRGLAPRTRQGKRGQSSHRNIFSRPPSPLPILSPWHALSDSSIPARFIM